MAPLVKLGILPPDYPVSCLSITGYSGGGKEMIAEFQDPGRDPALACPSLYSLGLAAQPLERDAAHRRAHRPAGVHTPF